MELIFIFTFTGILGLIIGSFLNVVVYRYPIMLKQNWYRECSSYFNLQDFLPSSQTTQNINLAYPRSYCPHCKKSIPLLQNIPFISYLFLHGKCFFCLQKISIQYPVIELITALCSVLVVSHFGLSFQCAATLIFTWIIIASSSIDINEQILPDALTFLLLWLGLLCSVSKLFVSPESAILGAIFGYGGLWIIAKLFHLIRKKEGMGYGDFKMLAMIGVWVGINNLLNVILMSVILGLFTSLFLLLRKKMTIENPIPFGPFLAIGGWFTLLYGPFIMNGFNYLLGG